MGRMWRVMLIDENVESREEVEALLEPAPVAVVGSCGSDREARALAVNTRPELIVAAVEEPTAPALETVRAVSELLPSSRVIVYSNMVDPKIVSEIRAIGVSELLLRPVHPVELLGAVNRIVAAGPDRVARRASTPPLGETHDAQTRLLRPGRVALGGAAPAGESRVEVGAEFVAKRGAGRAEAVDKHLRCPRCRALRDQGRFCHACGLVAGGSDCAAELPSRKRRLAGGVLDVFFLWWTPVFMLSLLGLAFTISRDGAAEIFAGSLLALGGAAIVWLTWVGFAARRSRTPGMQLLGLYLLRASDGTPASARRVWAREVLVKGALFGLAGGIVAYATTDLPPIVVPGLKLVPEPSGLPKGWGGEVRPPGSLGRVGGSRGRCEAGLGCTPGASDRPGSALP